MIAMGQVVAPRCLPTAGQLAAEVGSLQGRRHPPLVRGCCGARLRSTTAATRRHGPVRQCWWRGVLGTRGRRDEGRPGLARWGTGSYVGQTGRWPAPCCPGPAWFVERPVLPCRLLCGAGNQLQAMGWAQLGDGGLRGASELFARSSALQKETFLRALHTVGRRYW